MSSFKYTKHEGGAEPFGGPLRRESAVLSSGAIESVQASSAAAVGDQLNFSVRYALPEYVSFMWQHAGYLIRRRRIGRLGTLWMTAKSTSAAAMHFVAQGRSRRIYDFTVDDHGIIRTSGTGVTLVPWADVTAIRRYTRGYMMVLKRGTLPIPYRCLSRTQIAVMDSFAAVLRAAAKH
ncbi:MAG: YcxB family protein [Pseudomonadota bacterium]